jgi:hypothetical protein
LANDIECFSEAVGRRIARFVKRVAAKRAACRAATERLQWRQSCSTESEQEPATDSFPWIGRDFRPNSPANLKDLVMLFAEIVAQEPNHYVVVQSGISLGSALAAICSWDRNRSILLAAIAGVFSWFYVIYFAITREPANPKTGG